MLAALLTEINQPLTLTEIEPRSLAPGQVLIKVLVSGICGKQLGEIAGNYDINAPRPRPLGHEGCGIVEQVGPGVTKLKDGDKCIMHWRKGSGAESESPAYTYAGKTITGGQVTTFSEYSICSENRLTAVPQDTPNELCALLGCGLSTALGVMENEAKLRAGESVLIVGCGGVGLNLIRVARMFGAGTLVGLDNNYDKHKQAVVTGADYCRSGLAVEKHSFDVIVDTSGDSDTIANALPLLAGGGRFIMVGQPKPNWGVHITNARHLFDGEGKRIIATQGGGFNPDRDIPRYLQLWKCGKLSIDGIITHRYKLAQVNEALDAVRSGNAGRALLEMHTS